MTALFLRLYYYFMHLCLQRWGLIQRRIRPSDFSFGKKAKLKVVRNVSLGPVKSECFCLHVLPRMCSVNHSWCGGHTISCL